MKPLRCGPGRGVETLSERNAVASDVALRSSALDQVDFGKKRTLPPGLTNAARSNPRTEIPKMMPLQMV